MPDVRVHELAAEEAIEAGAWYERERPDLGLEFEGAIKAALDLLEGELAPLTPMLGAAGARGARRLILKRFPYDVVVQIWRDEILVLAFAHHAPARNPG
ncbi:MAG TPA: hypothetical protein VN783_13090 [Thermoanaerobaculia bacterium]|nr:hypothetical protein [Thermoanaerobaculia bacterium]